MSDFNATFATNSNCTRLNTGGTFALCECGQEGHNSLRRLNKDRRRRAKKTNTAGEGCRHHVKNALTCR